VARRILLFLAKTTKVFLMTWSAYGRYVVLRRFIVVERMLAMCLCPFGIKMFPIEIEKQAKGISKNVHSFSTATVWVIRHFM
jgi:hypothetical protein